MRMRDAGNGSSPPDLQAMRQPADLEACASSLSEDACLVGGATDVQLRRRQDLFVASRWIGTRRVAGLRDLSIPATGPVTLGAAVSLAECRDAVLSSLPSLAQCIEGIATPQIRNVATLAGNLLQDKRCWYYRSGFPCHKRTGLAMAPCYAVAGDHRFYHAALGASRCQAVTPSDLATVLLSLDATVHVLRRSAVVSLPIGDLYAGPGESVLQHGDILTYVSIPASARQGRSAYAKLNLWQGDFALVSVAIRAVCNDAGLCTDLRLAFGGLAPTPWRATRTERALKGEPLSSALLHTLLDAELNDAAHPLPRNAWKLDAAAGLAERTLDSILAADARRHVHE
jgi:CO/xanthine dehydrogenase FAD-binding subunit